MEVVINHQFVDLWLGVNRGAETVNRKRKTTHQGNGEDNLQCGLQRNYSRLNTVVTELS